MLDWENLNRWTSVGTVGDPTLTGVHIVWDEEKGKNVAKLDTIPTVGVDGSRRLELRKTRFDVFKNSHIKFEMECKIPVGYTLNAWQSLIHTHNSWVEDCVFHQFKLVCAILNFGTPTAPILGLDVWGGPTAPTFQKYWRVELREDIFTELIGQWFTIAMDIYHGVNDGRVIITINGVVIVDTNVTHGGVQTYVSPIEGCEEYWCRRGRYYDIGTSLYTEETEEPKTFYINYATISDSVPLGADEDIPLVKAGEICPDGEFFDNDLLRGLLILAGVLGVGGVAYFLLRKR